MLGPRASQARREPNPPRLPPRRVLSSSHDDGHAPRQPGMLRLTRPTGGPRRTPTPSPGMVPPDPIRRWRRAILGPPPECSTLIPAEDRSLSPTGGEMISHMNRPGGETRGTMAASHPLLRGTRTDRARGRHPQIRGGARMDRSDPRRHDGTFSRGTFEEVFTQIIQRWRQRGWAPALVFLVLVAFSVLALVVMTR